MKILYTYNLEANADNGDKNLYWGSSNAKFLKVKDVLKSTLKNYYDEKNISSSLNEFIIDFQKLCNKFQMCYLNSTGQLPSTIIKKILDSEIQEKTLKNVVIIGQSDYGKKWKNYNSAAVFCDLKIFNFNSKLVSRRNIDTEKTDVLFYFEIKRIEFLDLPYLDDSDEYNSFVDLRTVEFQEYKESELKSYYDLYKNSSDLSVIRKIKHTVEIFKNDEDLKEDINELKKWKEIIRKLFDLVNNESNLINYLFSFEEYNFSDLTKKDFYLISKQEKLNYENLIYFTFSQDDSISFRLKTKIKNQDKETEYFLKIIENKIQKNNEEINKISENIKTYFEDIDECFKEKETNEKYLEKKSNEINEFSNAKQRKELNKKNLNLNLNSHNESVKKILNKISELESDIESNNNEYESFEIEEKYKEIKKLIKEKNIYEKQIENIIQEIKKINDDIQSLNENLSKLKNEKSVIENKIKELDIKINYLERSINQNKKEKDKLQETNNNLNTLKECFTDKKFFVFKVSFSFNDEVENMDFVQIPFYDLNKAEQNLSTVSEDINGFRQKIKRYFHAISHAIDGNYRNPYLLHSINATPEIREIKELPLEIINKYNLNHKQLESVKKAISSRDTFYLQGPPGTGKTQVISAITDVLINQNKNILMTSSTHEAIHNFFDRLNDLSSKNPNIILLKDSVTDKEAKYSESNLYKNFIQKIKNYLLNENNQNNSLIEEIEKIKDEIINKEIWIFKNISSETINNLISKKFSELSNYEKEIKTKITEENFMDQDATVPEDILRRWYEKEFRKHTRNLKQSEKIKEILDKNYQLTGIHKSLKEIYLGNEKNSNYRTIEKIKEFFSKRDSEKIKGYQKEFNSYIFDKEIINVIGITTTAKTEIQIGTNKKNLFFEYPIDTVIIDEISKSSTPEILARIILSKKVIFAGDYMQLPPASDIDDSIIEKILINENLAENIVKIFGNNSYDDSKKEDLHNYLKKEFEKLFKNSFFKNQVQKIKNSYEKNYKSYEFLNIQHRFNKSIMELVNINYDYKEKLKMPENQKEFKKYSFDLMGTNYESYDVVSIDTTNLIEEYINKFKNKGLKNLTKISFDQSLPILYEKFNQKSGGQFNEYNAEVVLKICKSFLDKHSKEELKNKVGIICLSNNQKNLIKYIINANESFSELKDLKIKIDTIDNFQGREKEIIIVDFVRSLGKLNENNKSVNYENEKRNLNFISSIERNNVALSRAKNKLILIGSFNYYINSKSGSKITDLAKQYVEKSKYINFKQMKGE